MNKALPIIAGIYAESKNRINTILITVFMEILLSILRGRFFVRFFEIKNLPPGRFLSLLNYYLFLLGPFTIHFPLHRRYI
jgi:Na+/pantothenate symporter